MTDSSNSSDDGTRGAGGGTGIQGVTGLQGNTGLQGFTGIGGATGLQTVTYLEFSGNQRVPSNGTRYLRVGNVFTSQAGYEIFEAVTLTAISIRVNTSDATNDYDLEILSPSSASQTVIATLSFPSGTTATSTTVSIAISAGSELGARLVRTAGSGNSDFVTYTVLVKFE